jgi:putative heme-binding domain-containing protein
VWAAGPQEIRIAFDQPLDPEALKGLAGKIAIEGGEFAAAADRLETVRPGYATVEYQQNVPRFGVDVQAVQLTADRRTLILSTAAQFATVNYAIALRGIQLSPAAGKASHQIQQLPDIDLQYDLAGVEATYESPDGEKTMAWLPHLDLDVARELTAASADHDQFWSRAAVPGALVLRTSLNLGNMLRPAVRPGATIDYEWPQEEVTLTLKSNESFSVTLGDQATAAVRDANGAWTAERTVAGSTDHNYPLEVRLKHQSSEAAPKLTINYRTQEDARPRTLAIRRLLLPWARPSTDQPAIVDNASLPELAGGNWLRGRKEFFGSEAGCSKCHKVGGEGGSIGPDLSNLPKRDYASVLRDVTKPSFAINPDFVSHLVVTADGRVLAGTVRTEGEHLVVSDQEGKQTLVPREEVEEVQASEQSIMPEGIPKALGPARFRDLLTFLLVEPPSMPVYGELPPPEPRSAKEVDAILAGSKPAELKRQLNVTLVSGPKDHGLGEHDYPAWQKAWQRLLGMDEKVTVSTANPWPSEEQLRSADVLVFYQQGTWTPERARDIDRFLKRGGGLVYIHFAVDGGTDPAGFAERIGLAWRGGSSKFRHGPLELQFTSSKHPVARNFDRVHLYDESYWNLLGDAKRINLLATGVEEGKPQPLFWTVEPAAGGRVFVSIPGHFAWTFDDPLFRVLLLRGIAWTANESVDRFNELVLPGARVSAPAPANQ